MKPLFETHYSSWAELESAIAQLGDNKQMGDAFEEFTHFYLNYHRAFYQAGGDIYSPVVTGRLPVPVMQHLELEVTDHGVDGVFIRLDGAYVAYQSKFRTDPNNTIPYHELAKFWIEGKRAEYRLTVTNARRVTDLSAKQDGHLEVCRDKLVELDHAFFDALHEFATANAVVHPKPKKQPREYQIEILDSLQSRLETTERGKLIAACGIGKTLLSLWLVERRGDRHVLFLAPSLQLIRQTLGEWAGEAEPFTYICICSDKSVADEDDVMLGAKEIDIPVSTDPETVARFLSSAGEKKFVFSTYQSVPVLVDALSQTDFEFDIAIYDEAHRTAGSDGLFSAALKDDIRSKRRLFMTATERLVTSRVALAAEQANRVVFSMDDAATYGEAFVNLSFGEAI